MTKTDSPTRLIVNNYVKMSPKCDNHSNFSHKSLNKNNLKNFFKQLSSRKLATNFVKDRKTMQLCFGYAYLFRKETKKKPRRILQIPTRANTKKYKQRFQEGRRTTNIKKKKTQKTSTSAKVTSRKDMIKQ